VFNTIKKPYVNHRIYYNFCCWRHWVLQ